MGHVVQKSVEPYNNLNKFIHFFHNDKFRNEKNINY